MDFPREKNSLFKWRLAYKVTALLRKILGVKLTTAFSLNLSWVSSRIAYELSGEYLGDYFRNGALALSEFELLRIIKDTDRVLDIGCGTGRWSVIAARKAKYVLGIDYDPINLGIARNHDTNAEFILGDITSGLFLESNFDVALLIHILEHLDRPDEMLKILRALCSTLIIEVPDRESNPLNWARMDLGLDYYTDADHLREFNASELIELLDKTGWNKTSMLSKGGSLLIVAN
jgi:SAM-dependent methyltransferase